METKHTPGPWTVRGKAMDIDIGTDDTCVATIFHSDMLMMDRKETAANARLIAAAPELLAALRESVAIGDVREDYADWKARMDRARAAIAKAEGK